MLEQDLAVAETKKQVLADVASDDDDDDRDGEDGEDDEDEDISQAQGEQEDADESEEDEGEEEESENDDDRVEEEQPSETLSGGDGMSKSDGSASVDVGSAEHEIDRDSAAGVGKTEETDVGAESDDDGQEEATGVDAKDRVDETDSDHPEMTSTVDDSARIAVDGTSEDTSEGVGTAQVHSPVTDVSVAHSDEEGRDGDITAATEASSADNSSSGGLSPDPAELSNLGATDIERSTLEKKLETLQASYVADALDDWREDNPGGTPEGNPQWDDERQAAIDEFNQTVCRRGVRV